MPKVVQVTRCVTRIVALLLPLPSLFPLQKRGRGAAAGGQGMSKEALERWRVVEASLIPLSPTIISILAYPECAKLEVRQQRLL